MNNSFNTMPDSPSANREMLIYWMAMVVALGCALLVGYWVGTDNIASVVLCAMLVVMVLTIVGLRQRVWVLIPLFGSLGGGTLLLRIPLSPNDLAVMLAICGYGSYVTLSKKDTRVIWNGLDWVLFLNIVYLIATFLLHPVGLRSLGSGDIGGRPYFNILMAVLAYRLLVRMPDSPKTVSRLPILLSAGTTVMTFLQVLAYVFPGATPLLYFMFSNIDTGQFVASVLGPQGIGSSRLVGLQDFGQIIMPVLCAYYPPVTLLDFRRGRFYLMCAGMFCVMASGFRNILMTATAAVVIGAFLHKGWRGFVQVSVVGGILLFVVVLGQGRLYQLPLAAQRTLTLLPGDWDPEIKADTERSTQWRLDMWTYILEHNIIRDWWFGDGFAVRPSDRPAIGLRGEGTDNALITGGFHNGPLSTIRFVGLVGLALFYLLMIVGVYYSLKAVRLCRGTIYQPLAFYLAIRLVWDLILFTFVFGGYNTAMPEWIFYTALLRLTIRMAEELRAPAGVRRSIHSMLPGAFAAEPI